MTLRFYNSSCISCVCHHSPRKLATHCQRDCWWSSFSTLRNDGPTLQQFGQVQRSLVSLTFSIFLPQPTTLASVSLHATAPNPMTHNPTTYMYTPGTPPATNVRTSTLRQHACAILARCPAGYVSILCERTDNSEQAGQQPTQPQQPGNQQPMLPYSSRYAIGTIPTRVHCVRTRVYSSNR